MVPEWNCLSRSGLSSWWCLSAGAESKVSSVTFADRDLCAVPGSSVALRCSYDYPDGHTVRAVSWSKGVLTNGQWTRVKLSHLPALQNRSDYLGDLQHDCGLALSELEESDSGYYYFRFDTDTIGWRSRTSVYLAVTGMFFNTYIYIYMFSMHIYIYIYHVYLLSFL